MNTNMPEQNKKYGERLDGTLIDDGNKTYAISVIEQRDEKFLDIRSIYYRDNKPQFGKGVRIPMLQAEEALIVASAYLDEYTKQ